MREMICSRLNWARKLPDDKLLDLIMKHEPACVHCPDWDNENCQNCAQLLNWWQELVTDNQFRKDVYLNEKC